MVAAVNLKRTKIEISRQRFDRSLRNLAWWRSSTLMMPCVPQLEICNFKNPTWRPPFWKIEYSSYLNHSFSDFNEIWHGDAVRPSWPFGPFQIWDLKKSKIAAPGILTIWKLRYRGNGLTDLHSIWHIMTHIGPPNQACYSRTFERQFLCVNFAYANF